MKRVALPVVAGTLPLTSLLAPERAAVAADLSKLVLPSDQAPFSLPRPFHSVPLCDEVPWARLLLERGMAVLVEESLIPRDERGRFGGRGVVWSPTHEGAAAADF